MTKTFEPIKHLLPVVGKWDLSTPEQPTYKAPQAQYGKPFGICVSDVHFIEGEARVTVKMPGFKKENDTSGRLLFGYAAPNADYFLAGIGGSQFAYSLYQFVSGVGWQPIMLYGDANNIEADKAYNISVQIKGQRLVFKQDGISVFEHLLNSPIPSGQLGLFTWGSEPVEFTELGVVQECGTAFVIMQLTEPYLGIYNEVIKKVAESKLFKLETYHAGEAHGRVILQDIFRGLEEATVVIAEITPTNKNVFYELGYAHALKKPTILLVDRGSVCDLPFDIKGYRCIVYDNTIVGKGHIEKELEKNLGSILLADNNELVA